MDTPEIASELLEPTVVAIDEILDRTSNDWEQSSWSKLTFPLVPFPLFEKNRQPDNIGNDDYWIRYWLLVELNEIIEFRFEAIEWLKRKNLVEVKRNPVINIRAGIFDGEIYELVILDRTKLVETRDRLHQASKSERLKNKETDKQNTFGVGSKQFAKGQTIKSITCVKPELGQSVFEIFINQLFDHPIIGKINKDNWRLLYRVANQENIPVKESLPDNITMDWKRVVDYHNGREDNLLYSSSGCSPTKVLKIENGMVKPENTIQFELISKSQADNFKSRKKHRRT